MVKKKHGDDLAWFPLETDLPFLTTNPTSDSSVGGWPKAHIIPLKKAH